MIDVDFDFQADSHGKDPDSASETLKSYHQFLWSKTLPNGQMLKLSKGKGFYLKWNDMYFGSDSITCSFHWQLKEMVAKKIPDFDNFKIDYWHKTYRIGGTIIFPQLKWSMNQARGCHKRICDRWDLTLECIRRFYKGECTPLDKALVKSKSFFDLFLDFKGYVDFFLLQDCIDENYNVKFWLNTTLFETNPMPKTFESYLNWVQSQIDFVNQRNKRILDYCKTLGI